MSQKLSLMHSAQSVRQLVTAYNQGNSTVQTWSYVVHISNLSIEPLAQIVKMVLE